MYPLIRSVLHIRFLWIIYAAQISDAVPLFPMRFINPTTQSTPAFGFQVLAVNVSIEQSTSIIQSII